METDYKIYARELYKIKLAIIGLPANDDLKTLKDHLNKIYELKPRLNIELNDLAQEFVIMVPNLSKDNVREIEEINIYYVKKLQALANRLKKEIRTHGL